MSDPGNLLWLADGRRFSAVTIKRGDLRQAIAILRSVGVPGLRNPAPDGAEKPVPTRGDELFGRLAQIERAAALRAELRAALEETARSQ